MVFRKNHEWYCFYTAHPNMDGKDFVRTSPDLINWSESNVVAYGGQAGKGNLWYAECPFVVEPETGHYYLFRTQSYGSPDSSPKTSIYHSTDLKNFGLEDDRGFVGTLEVAAPEIFKFENRWYIAALMSNLNGIRVARLDWIPKETN
jgi:hypothetical protein